MWYKPRIYTLDHTTCLLCRPPLPLLISEAVKNCQDISCWRKLGGGDVWSCHKSEMFVTCGNARAHLFPNSCVAKTLKFNFQLFLCIFWCAPPHSKQFQRLPLTYRRHKNTYMIRGANPLLFLFSVMFVMTTFGSRKEFPSSHKSKVVLTNVTENSCRKTKMSFTIYAHCT